MTNSRLGSTEVLVVNGCALALRRHGTGTPVILFISGRGDSGLVWRHVVERLKPLGAITYDRPATGDSADLSGNPVEQPRPASWFARQLADLMDAAGVVDPLILVGHSIGGQTADAFAIAWPERVAGLVLVDPSDPDLQLDIFPPYPVIDDAAADRAGRGWSWDVSASAQEFRTMQPSAPPPAVVVASAIWRWFEAKEPQRYSPFSLAEVDQRWQRAQLEYALRWRGRLVVAHEAGHRVHEEAPGLVAESIAAVAKSSANGSELELDNERIRRAGGSIRPTRSSTSTGLSTRT
jgi:pimeloyl-ACP methyl ester carboxylesterase